MQIAVAGVRFTGSRLGALTFAPDRNSAEAVAVYRGYWLSSPFVPARVRGIVIRGGPVAQR